MSINTLQKSAFVNSVDFAAQVHSIVVTQALYYNDVWTEQEVLDDNTRTQLGQVTRQPQIYGFHSTIVSDNTWNLGFDAWAADPPAAKAEIEGRVQKYWLLLTGIDTTVASEPMTAPTISPVSMTNPVPTTTEEK